MSDEKNNIEKIRDKENINKKQHRNKQRNTEENVDGKCSKNKSKPKN